ncbi:hypothetical protein [Rhizomonospora bruguierae]|uniref:hypothetical protein n=1 Tax=Rhizomonospora bruguierae TaxID=1581705 RepID=UPI001BD04443|nr:hypothetical protein [Micromonospora sp. NBRC 107566]
MHRTGPGLAALAATAALAGSVPVAVGAIWFDALNGATSGATVNVTDSDAPAPTRPQA